MTAASDIKALIERREAVADEMLKMSGVKPPDMFMGYVLGNREALAIIEAEDAKRAEAIRAMVEALDDILARFTDAFPASKTYPPIVSAYAALNLARAAGLTEDKG